MPPAAGGRVLPAPDGRGLPDDDYGVHEIVRFAEIGVCSWLRKHEAEAFILTDERRIKRARVWLMAIDRSLVCIFEGRSNKLAIITKLSNLVKL